MCTMITADIPATNTNDVHALIGSLGRGRTIATFAVEELPVRFLALMSPRLFLVARIVEQLSCSHRDVGLIPRAQHPT